MADKKEKNSHEKTQIASKTKIALQRLKGKPVIELCTEQQTS
jgi:hypothetical protein